MPTAANNLTIRSTNTETSNAVNACISQTLAENPSMSQDQAVAI